MGSDRSRIKRDAAAAAAALIESGMRVGLGTGSTAELFVAALAKRIEAGEIENIHCTATSNRTEELARGLGIECTDLGSLGSLSITVDGADEIDPELRLIKGLGGALLREKIVAQASERMVVIADDSKLVEKLGRGVLPVEVVRFAQGRLGRLFELWGFAPLLRKGDDGEPFITDEGHIILDIRIGADDAGEVADRLRHVAGVVETGYFGKEATDALIASETGVRKMSRP